MPETLALPTTVPPALHEEGGESSGPNTVKVMVPVGLAPEESIAVTEEGSIAVPGLPLVGALTERVGLAGAATSSRPWVLVGLSL